MDRRQAEQHALQKLARAALPGLRKRGPSRVSAALWARPRLRFGPRVVHVAPFALVSIKTPQGFSVGADPENRVVFCVLLLGIVVALVCFF